VGRRHGRATLFVFAHSLLLEPSSRHQIGDVEKLAAKYPDVAADLRAIKDSIRES